jgi:predicted CopG family antitoxin
VEVIVVVMIMTTVSVTDDVKEKLLKVASELQIKLGRRVSLNEAICHLLSERERVKNPELLREACEPVPDAEKVAKQALDELYRERRLDEERLERKLGLGRKRSS